MIRVLFIGDADHQFIRNLVKKIKESNHNIEIDIFNVKQKQNTCNYDIYDNIYFKRKRIVFITKIPYLGTIYLKYAAINDFIRLKQKYDYIHMHMAWSFCYYIRNKIKYKSKKSILTIWGSDFYRANKKFKNRLFHLYKKLDKITFTNSQTLNDFSNFYNLNNHNLSVVRFGLEPLEFLNETIKNKKESREYLGLKMNKIIVTIGYNATPEQQHIKILERICNSKHKEYFRDKCLFVLPLTYAKRINYHKYKEVIESLLNRNTMDYILYEEFLSNKQIAHLRNASDIMIQLQISDQFSGSMQEYLYAQNLVITGDWLPYKDFDNEGIYYKKIDTINKVDKMLYFLIDNFKNEHKRVKVNKEIIYRLSSWDANIKFWNQLFDN